ncbi:FHA domain-containing protein [Rhodobacteraceae bacterium N5(2021)]|uniref:FHA domain-containing protein n=1 Tax=Gymnodinialimonas phycosphaerae TaxID=2841589 RepID=A0A975YG95_9RHOB|nr:FHA domain-containing protein [Gymnodinialimonas phycosphaerae]MBY4891431.1 FHA domain-containing protein [Gymnodinialimonas phycosphaerae]
MIVFLVRFRVRQIGIDGTFTGPSRILLCEEPGAFLVGKTDDADVPLPGDAVSRRHMSLVLDRDDIRIRDEGSTNGTYVNGTRVDEAALAVGDQVSIPGWMLELLAPAKTLAEVSRIGGVEVDASLVSRLIIADDATPPPSRRSFPDAEFSNRDTVTVEALRASGHPVEDTRFCTIGGGLGSFVWVDHLRCYGVKPGDIRAIGTEAACYQTYKRYCKNSQIPDHERLRSNSLSRPDNIWGFPGYALREAGKGTGFKGLFQVLAEPALAQSYTPRAGDVFDSLDAEAARIGWSDMRLKAQVLSLRKTDDGRYAVAYKLWGGEAIGEARNRYLIADVLHLSTGYPATRFVEDFQTFITNHPDARGQVANAYEPHDQMYLEAERRGGPVQFVVRGRGIVASRILQRLWEARQKNPQIRILHSMRSPLGAGDGARFRNSRRRVRNNVEIQPFNWPKACWGGDLRAEYEAADAPKRGALLAQLGVTTTAERADWINLIERGTQEGWYSPVFGTIRALQPLAAQPNQPEGVHISIDTPEGKVEQFNADYLIDCTGLIADIRRSPFLADLLDTFDLARNHSYGLDGDTSVQGPATGLAASNDFEIEGLRNGAGRVYAAGTITTGGPYLAVDSFLGLQYAALRSVDHLAAEGAHKVRRLGPLRSAFGWSKWMLGAKP